MYESTCSRILDNSSVLRLLRLVASGSLLLKVTRGIHALTRRFGQRLSQVAAGSYCLSLFKVRDYLKADSTGLLASLRQSGSWRLIRKLSGPPGSWLAAVLQSRISRNSVFNRLSGRLREYRDDSLTRRDLLIFLLVFSGAFYTVRLPLVKLIPESGYYLSWSSGLILALLLIALTGRLIPRGQQSLRTGGAGILENTGRALPRLARFIARSCGRLISGVVRLSGRLIPSGKNSHRTED